jgi:hypothetical protein
VARGGERGFLAVAESVLVGGVGRRGRMAGIPPDVAQVLDRFDEALSAIEHTVRPLLDAPVKDVVAQLDSLATAKLNLAYSYSMNSLFYMFLKVQGVSPQGHPVRAELERVKRYMSKTLATEAEMDKRHSGAAGAAGAQALGSEPAPSLEQQSAGRGSGTSSAAPTAAAISPPAGSPQSKPGTGAKKRHQRDGEHKSGGGKSEPKKKRT